MVYWIYNALIGRHEDYGQTVKMNSLSVTSLHSRIDNGSPVRVFRSNWVAEQLTFPTLDHEVPGLNPATGRVPLMTVWCFIAQSLSSSIYRLDMAKNVERDVKHQTHNILTSY